MVHSGFSFTLARYVGRRFVMTTCLTLLALTGLISLFDFIDLLRRAAAHPEAGLMRVLEITALHVPYYVIYILPFAILLGGVICFSRLARSSELVVTRAAGISAWQVLTSPALCAALMGLAVSAGLSPLSSFSYGLAAQLDKTWLRGQHDHDGTRFSDLWIRDPGNPAAHGDVIFHIGTLQQQGQTLRGQAITIFRLGHDMTLQQRMEVSEGLLADGLWRLHGVLVLSDSHPPQWKNDSLFPSGITAETLKQRTLPADALSLWALPGVIKLLRHSGFSTIPYRLHFQGLLALPMLAVTMTLVSAGFSMRPAGRGGIMRMLGVGVTAGFALFAVSKIAEQLGKSGALPPFPAAWGPAGAGLCLAAALLLHLEDG
ncbi:LPS export ABC transporter permease LptG [Parasaccharibacter sp. TMW2.1890]|uniref:LPS export ABC transporter permease LptG n=1 Tax=Parasaccharibacter sp. TMW2.1890 TaxID=2039289 RepID=UPI002012B6C0|nr:LPS export ABC transporter permease LptG [Parasaccharibacter sp. TMW2.1890]MCL1515325.1 LPS export ABC transporter permease LptG [Parasaccharibacter sp. TMW2.1890]